MLKIRLTRTGRRNRPAYRIVVQDAKVKRDSPALDILGTYDPIQSEEPVAVDVERARRWLKKGAQPTEKAAVLLKKAGVKVG